MKTYKFVIVLLLTLMSCNKDSEKSLFQDFQGTWVLVKMSGNTPNSETMGTAMAWQENYVFKSDGMFLKSRKKDGNITHSKGSFTVLKSEERTTLELTHFLESQIVGSCFGNQKEVLFLESKELLLSTWNQCDGPGLVYEKQ